MNAPLVSFEHVSFHYAARPVLTDVNFAVGAGEIVSLIGPNGAGKTTLIKLMVGLLQPMMGKVISSPGLRMGYVPQRFVVDRILPLTVKRFLTLGVSGENFLERLEELGILSLIDSPLYALSGGELQRVLLARALLLKPNLLVLDEPAQGVDLMGQSAFYEKISSISKRLGCGVFLVSHDLNVVMARANRIICLNEHICCSGSPESVSHDPAFQALFGKLSPTLAFYTHHHDHYHHHINDTISNLEPLIEDDLVGRNGEEENAST